MITHWCGNMGEVPVVVVLLRALLARDCEGGGDETPSRSNSSASRLVETERILGRERGGSMISTDISSSELSGSLSPVRVS